MLKEVTDLSRVVEARLQSESLESIEIASLLETRHILQEQITALNQENEDWKVAAAINNELNHCAEQQIEDMKLAVQLNRDFHDKIIEHESRDKLAAMSIDKELNSLSYVEIVKTPESVPLFISRPAHYENCEEQAITRINIDLLISEFRGASIADAKKERQIAVDFNDKIKTSQKSSFNKERTRQFQMDRDETHKRAAMLTFVAFNESLCDAIVCARLKDGCFQTDLHHLRVSESRIILNSVIFHLFENVASSLIIISGKGIHSENGYARITASTRSLLNSPAINKLAFKISERETGVFLLQFHKLNT